MPVIAIDGPAGSGKSTVARTIARRLAVDYLDTGAMYRSVTAAALRRGIDPADAERVAALARELDISVADRVTVDGIDVTDEIRGTAVTTAVSTVAANPAVREELRRRQREWVSKRGDGVVEGRDIGTVVLPDADLKVFLTADDAERARRRALERGEAEVGAVQADIARRDRLDSTRAAAPLAVADDAVVIDTTGRTIDDVVEEVLSRL